MFCTQCGEPLKDGVNFCPRCGAAVSPVQEDKPTAPKQPGGKGPKKLIPVAGVAVAVAVVLVAAVLLNSVLGKQGPEKDELKTDLEESLTVYADFLQINSVDVSIDVVENNVYTAEVDVTAESQYADFQLAADVVYIQENEEWTLSDCVWTRTGYEVKQYPSQEEMTVLVNNNEEIQCYSLVNQNLWEYADFLMIMNSNRIELTCQNMEIEGDAITFDGYTAFWMGPRVYLGAGTQEYLISANGTIRSVWRYEPDTDGWKLEDVDRNIEFCTEQGPIEITEGTTVADGIQYSFDQTGRLRYYSFSSSQGAYELQYEYDMWGHLTKQVLIENALETRQYFSYDGTGKLIEITTEYSSANVSGWRIEGTYNELGQLVNTTMYDSSGTAISKDEYVYDDENGTIRMISDLDDNESMEYVYDHSGTLLERIHRDESGAVLNSIRPQ